MLSSLFCPEAHLRTTSVQKYLLDLNINLNHQLKELLSNRYSI